MSLRITQVNRSKNTLLLELVNPYGWKFPLTTPDAQLLQFGKTHHAWVPVTMDTMELRYTTAHGTVIIQAKHNDLVFDMTGPIAVLTAVKKCYILMPLSLYQMFKVKEPHLYQTSLRAGRHATRWGNYDTTFKQWFVTQLTGVHNPEPVPLDTIEL
jgi:hypothetical protein